MRRRVVIFCESDPCPPSENEPSTYTNPFKRDPTTGCVWIEGYESYTTYTPTLTGVSLGGAGATVAKWKWLDNWTVHFVVFCTLASGFSVTGPSIGVTLPVNAMNALWAPVKGAFVDFGTTFVPAVISQSASGVSLFAPLATGPDIVQANVSSTVPFTWAIGDQFHVGGIYETAAAA